MENKAVIHSGILCLNPKVVTLLGGVVQSLYEEWEMNKKYSGFSRSSLRTSQESGTAGPPPFEKLQIETPSSSRFGQPGRSSREHSGAFKGGVFLHCHSFLFFACYLYALRVCSSFV